MNGNRFSALRKPFLASLGKSSLLFLLIFSLCGCKTVRHARHIQTGTDRLPGESTVTAEQAGLASGGVLSLAALERIAQTYHPSLLQARQDVEAARLQVAITRSSRFPQVSASGSYTRSTQNSWGKETSTQMKGSWSGSAGLDLLLYDFGRLDAEEKQARETLIAGEEQLRDTELAVVYDVRTAFFEHRRREHLLHVALESERQYAEHLNEARIMAEVGTRRKYDVTKAEVDLGNARLDVVTASNNLTVAHAELNRALGLAQNPDYRLEDAELPATVKTADEWMADARVNAPALTVLRARERAASAYVDQTIAELYPEFSLGTDAGVSGRNFPFIWNFSWGLSLVQDLFDGHRRTARIDAAVSELRSARSRVAAEEQSLYLDVVSTLADKKSAQEKTAIARLTAEQAQENLDIVNEQYRVGLSSAIERTDAQVAVTQAKANVIGSYYDEQTAAARLVRLTGIQPPSP